MLFRSAIAIEAARSRVCAALEDLRALSDDALRHETVASLPGVLRGAEEALVAAADELAEDV